TKIEVEQLRTTKNFEDREFLDIKFGVSILRGLNLSRFNLTGCQFLGDLTDVNFTEAVISKCDFGVLSNITIDQIKSTWNYKAGRMNGIKLPDKIQKELDAEKNNPKK
ncbi:MAG: pentapeptide repeat-containing protein, partial [Planctomycetaceae bacterium]|nr:pentapeptide repeat-containing protein [Planctomycetaceae bacterium]